MAILMPQDADRYNNIHSAQTVSEYPQWATTKPTSVATLSSVYNRVLPARTLYFAAFRGSIVLYNFWEAWYSNWA